MNETMVTTPTETEIVTTRVFDAPRALVFAAHAECEHLKQWWGRGNPLDCDLDFRPGGHYRFVEHAPEGNEAFRGEVREIVPDERIVYTFEWEGMPGHVCIVALDFADADGGTLLTGTTTFANREDRDGMVNSGMEIGINESYRFLDALLKTLV
jgi:uncharacterized protein YndB with AHSA1/START domain